MGITMCRVALANLRYPDTPEDSIQSAKEAIARASAGGADVICFPEGLVPGYRGRGRTRTPPDLGFLERAWSQVQSVAAKANIAVILGTERLAGARLRISALVLNPDGTTAGFQDKVQLDPS